MPDTTSNPNADVIEAWNTVLFDKFSRYKHLLIEGLGLHGSKLFEEFPPKQGAQVVDIGCGFGDTTVQLAEMVGPEGKVVGIDCAENFIESANERATSAGVKTTSFLCRDVQFDDLGGPYDAAYSRFGTMFFNSPVVALKQIRKSLKPGGTLAMSVWRKRQDNPCFYTAQEVVERYIQPEDKDTSLVTCGPGPFSMAGPDMVSDQLMAAGFSSIQFTRFDAPLCIGHSIDEALSFARDLGPAGESLRLASEKAAHLSEEIESSLREAFKPFLRDDGVWATSSTWLVTATAKN
jgi:ubiquinone/menaquinone biosynthesis C-methylase UbiE